MMDIKQIKHFLALAESGNYSRAAESVHLSQSALSRSIQQLEHTVNATLFERGRFGASLTAYGQVVLPHARSILQSEDAIMQEVGNLDALKNGNMTIGCGPYVSLLLIDKVVAQFVDRYPDVKMVIVTDHWQRLRSMMLENKLDIFVADIRELVDDANLTIELLPNTEGELFCRANHPLTLISQPSLPQILAYPIALPKLPEELERAIFVAAAQSGSSIRRIECENVGFLISLVGQSNALSIAPETWLSEHKKQYQLEKLDSQYFPKLKTAYGFVTKKNRIPSPAAIKFRQLLMQSIGLT